MKDVRVLVLAGEGINCEQESAAAFQRVGSIAEIKHVREWMSNPKLVHNYHILVFPGGFSYGDELHSGQILALDLKYSVGQELKSFIANRGLILGICNGFQILMKLGIFEPNSGSRSMTLFHNQSFKFQNRWVECHAQKSKCIWTQGIERISMPARHGEGRIVFDGDEATQLKTYENLKTSLLIAFEYSNDINGSYGKIAGLTDKTGQILGLMPHPEAALDAWLYPEQLGGRPEQALQIFKNAFAYVLEHR